MQRLPFDLLIAAVLVLGIGGLVYTQKQSSLTPAMGTATTTPMAAGITLEEIARHGTRTDCWSAINGAVYDLTSWVPQHPGGEQAILTLCGTDGSATFNGQHGGAPRQAAILAGFKVGELAGATTNTGVTAPAAVPAGDTEDDRGRGRGRGGDDN